jgi:hypothetical protein
VHVPQLQAACFLSFVCSHSCCATQNRSSLILRTAHHAKSA